MNSFTKVGLIVFISSVVMIGVYVFLVRREVKDGSNRYYVSEEECEKVNYGSCKCMVTNIDTEMCVGWAPGI